MPISSITFVTEIQTEIQCKKLVEALEKAKNNKKEIPMNKQVFEMTPYEIRRFFKKCKESAAK